MDPISNVDRIVLLLRRKLEERGRSARAGGNRPKSESTATTSPVTGLGAIAAIEGVDERQLRRTFIQMLLADQLGANLVNDAQFQQVVTRVTEAIEEDAAASRLLSRLISDLRAA